jgi:hypothetical protein
MRPIPVSLLAEVDIFPRHDPIKPDLPVTVIVVTLHKQNSVFLTLRFKDILRHRSFPFIG